jgi:homocysteine S-methyltransferase
VMNGLDGAPWQRRLVFFRPNASTMSHEELDAMEVLDSGDVSLLVESTKSLREQTPALAVLGGCCGTDSRHVAALWGVTAPR